MSFKFLTRQEKQQISEVVDYYKDRRHVFDTFAKGLVVNIENNRQLHNLIHFIKYRTKDPSHLKEKLARKASAGKADPNYTAITIENLFSRITDLAGIRLIHLHTNQMASIHDAVMKLFQEYNYRLFEEPTANVWDVEFQTLFESMGIRTTSRNSMYTTVHYVIEANQRTQLTCELQIRTLMDEVWGEVSHKVNYPVETSNETCAAQLKILARLTSGCTRLVDSIFDVHNQSNPRRRKRKAPNSPPTSGHHNEMPSQRASTGEASAAQDGEYGIDELIV